MIFVQKERGDGMKIYREVGSLYIVNRKDAEGYERPVYEIEVDEAELVKIDIERFKKEIADYTDESGYVDIPLSILLNTLYEVIDDKRR